MGIKHTLDTILPKQSDMMNYRSLRVIEHWVCQPNLWHCNRKSVAAACFIGLFVAMIPLPMQMLIAASSAIVLKANIPLAVSLVWITNPLTIAPIFYFCYKVGAWLLQVEMFAPDMQAITQWSFSELLAIWQPLFFGSLLIGTLAGLFAFYLVNWSWRKHVINKWRMRCVQRALQQLA